MVDGIETNAILPSLVWVTPLTSLSKVLYSFNFGLRERLVVIHT